ncbi:MAG: hypothetical protein F6K30_19600 [Cyanothece sp. SIO2G6]|nr:hypothetical protein [Cyanothece sp. SIO2G6]
MALPVVMREEAVGFHKFKTYWQGSVVTSAFFERTFYQLVQRFSHDMRLLGYQVAVQLAQEHEVLVTVCGSDKAGYVYTVWADRWVRPSTQDSEQQVVAQR